MKQTVKKNMYKRYLSILMAAFLLMIGAAPFFSSNFLATTSLAEAPRLSWETTPISPVTGGAVGGTPEPTSTPAPSGKPTQNSAPTIHFDVGSKKDVKQAQIPVGKEVLVTVYRRGGVETGNTLYIFDQANCKITDKNGNPLKAYNNQ